MAFNSRGLGYAARSDYDRAIGDLDHQGRPTVSYKGGDPGFVRVFDSKTVAFPCYDGNGMCYSMGNLLGNPLVGMLFLNFKKPHRLRQLWRRSRHAEQVTDRFPQTLAIGLPTGRTDCFR